MALDKQSVIKKPSVCADNYLSKMSKFFKNITTMNISVSKIIRALSIDVIAQVQDIPAPEPARNFLSNSNTMSGSTHYKIFHKMEGKSYVQTLEFRKKRKKHKMIIFYTKYFKSHLVIKNPSIHAI